MDHDPADILQLLTRIARLAGWVPVRADTDPDRVTLTITRADLAARDERHAETGEEL